MTSLIILPLKEHTLGRLKRKKYPSQFPKIQLDVFKCVLSEQPFRTHKYSIFSYRTERKASQPHIEEAELCF